MLDKIPRYIYFYDGEKIASMSGGGGRGNKNKNIQTVSEIPIYFTKWKKSIKNKLRNVLLLVKKIPW